VAQPFLGRGWAFPVDVDGTGALQQAADEESIRQSVWIILGTAPGERVMRPDFGCGIYDLVFEVNNSTTAARISHAVQDALLMHEPRIDVVNVSVDSDDGGPVLKINVDYQIRATDNVFNLVYPFYLDRSAG
jgi:hypothetical protein